MPEMGLFPNSYQALHLLNSSDSLIHIRCYSSLNMPLYSLNIVVIRICFSKITEVLKIIFILLYTNSLLHVLIFRRRLKCVFLS